MHVVIVYEPSASGVRRIAEAVGVSLERSAQTTVDVVPAGSVASNDLVGADVVIVGGTTHRSSAPARGRPAVPYRPTIRTAARPDLDGGAGSGTVLVDIDGGGDDLPTIGPGLRQWFRDQPRSHGHVAAAFDIHRPGEQGAAGVIARRMGRLGYRVVGAEGFRVDDVDGRVTGGEVVRAENWGSDLTHQVASALPR